MLAQRKYNVGTKKPFAASLDELLWALCESRNGAASVAVVKCLADCEGDTHSFVVCEDNKGRTAKWPLTHLRRRVRRLPRVLPDLPSRGVLVRPSREAFRSQIAEKLRGNDEGEWLLAPVD